MPKQFAQLKDAILGKRYDLSFAYVSPAAMRRAMKYKASLPKKTSNILAFPLSPTSGEILICKEAAKKEAEQFRMSQKTFLAYLFIHGALHIKGMRHNATMEREERRIMKKFGLRRLASKSEF